MTDADSIPIPGARTGAHAVPIEDRLAHAERLVVQDFGAACGIARALREEADREHDERSSLTARRILGQALAYANQFDEAEGVLLEGIDSPGAVHFPVEGARLRLVRVHILARRGKFAIALSEAKAAVETFERQGERVLAAQAHSNMGVVLRMTGEPGDAVDCFARAAATLRDRPVMYAQVQSNMAEALLEQGRFEDARVSFGRALEAFLEAGATMGAGIVEGNLADLAAQQGKYADAIRWFEVARRSLREADGPGDAARLAVEHADVLRTIGSWSSAEHAYRDAIPVLREMGLEAELARACLGLGEVLAQRGGVVEAQGFLREAGVLFATQGVRSGIGRVLLAQASGCARVGEWTEAQKLVQAADAPLADRPVDRERARVLRARALLGSSHADEALDLIGAHDLGDAGHDVSPLAAERSWVRAAALRALGRIPDASRAYRHAIAHADRARATLQGDRLRTGFLGARAAVFNEAASNDLDEAAIEPAFARECRERAWNAIEHGRARGLGDLAAGDWFTTPDANARPADAEVGTKLRDARERVNAAYRHLDHLNAAPPAQVSRWQGEIASGEREIEQLEHRLAAHSPLAALVAPVLPLTDVLASIGAGEAMVEYFEDEGSLSAMVLSAPAEGERLHVVRRLVGLSEITNLVQRLHLVIGRVLLRAPIGQVPMCAANDPVVSVLSRQHDAVWKPIAGFVEHAAHIGVCPGRVLAGVPFASLWSESGPLVRSKSFTSLPSASFGARLRAPNTQSVPEGSALFVGVDDVHAPQAADEARIAASAVPGATLLVGADATMENVKRAIAGVSLFHVACHARFDEANPFASAIRLADGWLTARDLAAARLDGATVVLSACNTGQSSSGAADDPDGFIRAMFASGARRLITTMWPAHDRSAHELMGNLFSLRYPQSTKSRLSWDQCLCLAQRTACERGENPAAWGVFSCTGW